eukprot:gene10571-22061_t
MLIHGFFLSGLSFTPPAYIHIGLIGPQFTFDGQPNVAGRQSIAAVIMAVKEINNATDDGFGLDNILPNTIIDIAFQSPRQDYLEAVGAALYLSGSAFNGSGIIGLIGTSATDSSKATAEVFSNTPFKIPQIAYGAESSDLGHSIYSHFTRVCPSDAYEGRIIARMVKKYFQWSTVTIFASGDTFGNDITLEFLTEAAIQGGITVEAKYSFWSGITDFTSIIQTALDKGGIQKIFLLFMKSQDTGILMEQGYKMGLFKEGTQIIGTEYMASIDTIKAMSSSADISKIMNGAIAITNTLQDKMKTINFQNFIKRFHNQKSTMLKSKNGTVTYCDPTKDDTHKEYLYMGHKNGIDSSTETYTCAGLDFKSMATDGSDMSKEAIFAYDATYALAYALHNILYIQQMNITGDLIISTLLHNVSFNGLSGPIKFNKGGPGFEKYGQGDRLGGNDFQFYNFNPKSYVKNDYGSSAWFETGIYTYKSIFEPCNTLTNNKCTNWIYNTVDNSKPIDHTPFIEIQMDDSTRTGLRFGVAMALLLVIIFTVVLISCEKTRLIKASQPRMMKIVIFGAILACLRVILATVDLNDSLCIIGKWLGHMSFALVFGALVIKIWRVNVVANSGFRKVKVTSRQPHMSYDEIFDGHYNLRLMKCTNKNEAMTIALYVIEGILLFAGGKLCWSTKDVPDGVNDSRYIAMTMYLIVFVCSVTFPIVYFKIDPKPALLMMVMAVGFIVATLGCVSLLFGPKTRHLWNGDDVDENFAIVKGGFDNNNNNCSSNVDHKNHHDNNNQHQNQNPVNNLVALRMRISGHSHNSSSIRDKSSKSVNTPAAAAHTNTTPPSNPNDVQHFFVPKELDMNTIDDHHLQRTHPAIQAISVETFFNVDESSSLHIIGSNITNNENGNINGNINKKHLGQYEPLREHYDEEDFKNDEKN